MNDRFKFRVWDKINEIWVKNFSIDEQGCVEGFYNPPQAMNRRLVLMQSTGLKDKNGKLIYEGDIVKFKTELFGTPKQIIWDECHYILKDTFIILCDMEIKQFGLEVIGNIYENPELLKECD